MIIKFKVCCNSARLDSPFGRTWAVRLMRGDGVKRSSPEASQDVVLLFVHWGIWLLCSGFVFLVSGYWRVCTVQPGIGGAMHWGWQWVEGVFLFLIVKRWRSVHCLVWMRCCCMLQWSISEWLVSGVPEMLHGWLHVSGCFKLSIDCMCILGGCVLLFWSSW